MTDQTRLVFVMPDLISLPRHAVSRGHPVYNNVKYPFGIAQFGKKKAPSPSIGE
jgi:hypothetical protein